MIDVAKEFEPFLKDWCHKHHVPVPKRMNKHWMSAWQDFMDTYLKDHYEEIRQAYLDLPLLSNKSLKMSDNNQSQYKKSSDSSDTVSTEPQTAWSRIKNMLQE